MLFYQIQQGVENVADRIEIRPYRFYFVSHDISEPPHIHIDRDDLSAKFWLSPVALAYNLGFPAAELRKLESLTTDHQKTFMEAWHEFFGT